MTNYSYDAVQREIVKDKRIGKREASRIHALLKGREPTYYAVQGLRQGEWQTLFAPLNTADDAKHLLIDLSERNPACQYRYVRIADGITYV